MEGEKKVEIKRRHQALVVLKCLLDGHTIIHEGEEWYYQDGVFGVKRGRLRGGESEEVILGVDMSLPAFVKWCERLPEVEIVQMAFNAVLKGMKSRIK